MSRHNSISLMTNFELDMPACSISTSYGLQTCQSQADVYLCKIPSGLCGSVVVS